MKITDVPFAVLRFQYQIARCPLQLIEDQVAARVDSDAPGRLFYERSLGTLDATVGNLLGDDDLARRGTALVERSDVLIQATKLEANAAAKEQDADETLKEKRDSAVRAQQEAREKRDQEVKDAKTTAAKRKRTAAEATAKRTADAKRQADQLAAERRETVEATKREQQAVIREAEEQVAADAEAKREDAAKKLAEAEAKREQADAVEALADVEKHSRKSGPLTTP